MTAENTEKPIAKIDETSAPALTIAEQTQRFELIQRQAKALNASTLVPPQFQGEKNLGNAIIAMEIAQRLNASPLMVCQNLYVVHNQPSWSSKFLIACFNSCGRFTAIRYEMSGAEGTPERACVAWCIEKRTGERIDGPKVSVQMATQENWGPKWKTMPEQMLRYRAAAFLVRTVAPEITMGLQTTEEAEDIAPRPVDAEVVADVFTPGKHRRARAPKADAPAIDAPDGDAGAGE